MYEIVFCKKIKKDLERCKRRGFPKEKIKEIIEQLQETGTVPRKNYPHILSGDYEGIWECHITPDWLLLWIINGNTITLLRTGTHSDLY